MGESLQGLSERRDIHPQTLVAQFVVPVVNGDSPMRSHRVLHDYPSVSVSPDDESVVVSRIVGHHPLQHLLHLLRVGGIEFLFVFPDGVSR